MLRRGVIPSMDKLSITREQSRDAGMALCLLCFLVGAARDLRWLEWAAMAVLFVDMLAPTVFKPFAVVWFGASTVLATVTSKVLLSALFFLLVTPTGVVRGWMGRDPMRARRWKKKSRESVFVTRNHVYTGQDVDGPY